MSASLSRALDRALSTSWCPHRPHPKQAEFLALDCREALYGGAAGGGKSDALLMAALQHVDKPGYNAAIFRKTYSDLALPGAIMDRAHSWLASTKAHWDGVRKQWRFPSGARISFGYLQTANDRYRYQGAEFQFCVAVGTPILMADRSWQPIESIGIGDEVMTLVGPRRVTATWCPGVKPVVRLRTPAGDVRVSASHRLLSERGWLSPEALRPTQSHAVRNTDGWSTVRLESEAMRDESIRSGRAQATGRGQRTMGNSHRPVMFSSSAVLGIGCEESGGSHQEVARPLQWSSRLVLHEPSLRSEAGATIAGVCVHGRALSSLLGCSVGCSLCRGRCDAPLRSFSTGDRACILQPADAEAPCSFGIDSDGPARTHARSQTERLSLVHPYTSEAMVPSEAVQLTDVDMSLAGEEEVRDLTVEGAAHYIAWGGIIASNCAFDELTQFDSRDYLYLFSRLRAPNGLAVPLRMRAASNPGGLGHDWVHERFVAGGDPQRRFVPALMSDNPSLDSVQYRASLSELDSITRRQLEDGVWEQDPTGLVYRVTPRNVLKLPMTRVGSWTYMVAHDYGIVDSNAIALAAWEQHSDVVHILRSFYVRGMADDVAREHKALCSNYEVGRTIGDIGGLGKAFAAELMYRHNVPIQQAQKADKLGHIKLFNGALERGKILFHAEGCSDLLAEYPKLVRMRNGNEATGVPNHCADATLYAWRECRAYMTTPKKQQPTDAERMARMEAEALAELRGDVDAWED